MARSRSRNDQAGELTHLNRAFVNTVRRIQKQSPFPFAGNLCVYSLVHYSKPLYMSALVSVCGSCIATYFTY